MAQLFKKITNWWDDLFPEKSKKVNIKYALDASKVSEEESIEKQHGLVAFIIGHNEKFQGAVNYLDESEYSFSKRILNKVQIKLLARGHKSILIERPPVKSYSTQVKYVAEQCREYGVTHAILSHFNSAGKTARGCEFLIPYTLHPLDNSMADMATDLLNKRLGIKERHNDGVYEVKRSHNGSGMLYALDDLAIPATLAEPCFAKYRTVESAAIFENEDAYVDILVDVAEACSNGTIKDYQG